MYENEFKQILAKNQLADAYLIYGSCELSLLVLKQRLLKIWQAENVLLMSSSDFDINYAKEYLEVGDLFYSSKLLVLELANDEVKSFKLNQLVNAANKSAKLLVINKTQKALKTAEKEFGKNFVRVFNKVNDFEKLNLLQEYAQVLNVKAARDDLIKLADAYSEDIFQAGSELRKFAGANLDLLMCDLSCTRDLDVDELFDALFIRGSNLAKISALLEPGDEIVILNKLSASFLRLFKLNTYAKTHAKLDFSVALGFNPPTLVRNKLEKYSFMCDNKFEDIFEALIQANCEIILESNQAQNQLLSTLIKINLIIN